MSEEGFDYYSPDVASILSQKSKRPRPTGSDRTGTSTKFADFPRISFLFTPAGRSVYASSSEAGTLHARELEAAYALWYSSTKEGVKSPESRNEAESSEMTDLDEMKRYRDHPILVRDYAFDEDDERFSKAPLELMPPFERPSLTLSIEIGSLDFFLKQDLIELGVSRSSS
jgi:hypothetical protein